MPSIACSACNSSLLSNKHTNTCHVPHPHYQGALARAYSANTTIKAPTFLFFLLKFIARQYDNSREIKINSYEIRNQQNCLVTRMSRAQVCIGIFLFGMIEKKIGIAKRIHIRLAHIIDMV